MSVNPGSPYTLHVDHAARTIVLKGSGSATTADTLRLIAAEQQAFLENLGYGVLYDAVDLTIESSAADMVKVAEALFGDGTPPISRFAVVVPPSRTQLAMMFTALAQGYGINACVFTDRLDAEKWLGPA